MGEIHLEVENFLQEYPAYFAEIPYTLVEELSGVTLICWVERNI